MDVFADLHIHSTASDGTFRPARVAEECYKKGIRYAVLTDHDTVAGVFEFLNAAERLNIHATTGIEFSVQYDGELHILAYGVDIQNPHLLSVLDEMENRRVERAKKIVLKLQSSGIDISIDEVEAEAQGEVIGRPHIGLALVKKGVVPSVSEAFRLYLSKGCPGFVQRHSLTEQEAMDAIKIAGGFSVFAHPKLTYAADFDALVKRLKALGLDGIEAYYPEHTEEECAFFSRLGEKYGLFLTQGSDSHGDMRGSTYIGKEIRGNSAIAKAISLLF